jgi:hypothetical protein
MIATGQGVTLLQEVVRVLEDLPGAQQQETKG